HSIDPQLASDFFVAGRTLGAWWSLESFDASLQVLNVFRLFKQIKMSAEYLILQLTRLLVLGREHKCAICSGTHEPTIDRLNRHNLKCWKNRAKPIGKLERRRRQENGGLSQASCD